MARPKTSKTRKGATRGAGKPATRKKNSGRKRRAAAPKKARRGRRMDPGNGWRLTPPGAKIVFAGTLLTTLNAGGVRIAIFSVPKR